MSGPLGFTPDPNTAHPDLPADMVRRLREWTELRPSSWIPMQTVEAPPGLHRWTSRADEPESISVVRSTFTYTRARGPAVYVGRPFLWEWEVAVGERGRWVATDSTPLYAY